MFELTEDNILKLPRTATFRQLRQYVGQDEIAVEYLNDNLIFSLYENASYEVAEKFNQLYHSNSDGKIIEFLEETGIAVDDDSELKEVFSLIFI